MTVHIKASSRIPAILASVDAARRNAVAEGTAQMVNVSQDKVPVDTGALKSSREKTIVDAANSTKGTVTYNTNYAIYVEFGTSKMAAQPYLIPAHRVGKAAMIRSLSAWLARV